MHNSITSEVGGRQRTQTTIDVNYLLKSHEKLMDFYHMKAMRTTNKVDQTRFFSLRDYHFKAVQRFFKDYVRDRDIDIDP